MYLNKMIDIKSNIARKIIQYFEIKKKNISYNNAYKRELFITIEKDLQ